MSSIATTASHSSATGWASFTGIVTSVPGSYTPSTGTQNSTASTTSYSGLSYTTFTQSGTVFTILLCSQIPATAPAPSYGCWGRSSTNDANQNGMSAGKWALGAFFMAASVVGLA